MRWVVLGLVAALAGCTADNPHACDEDGACGDPARPYCDLDGLIAGVPGSCIAVSCEPGSFAACDGDRALQCSANGMDYDNVLCARGCDPLAQGCRACAPDETACTDDIVSTCDANGNVIETFSCALGCSDTGVSCVDVVPSNDLEDVLAMAHDASPLALTDGQVVDVTDGSVDGTVIPSVLIAAPPGGVAIRAFPLRSLTITGVVRVIASAAPAYAVAFLVDSDVVVSGDLILGDLELGFVPGGLSVDPQSPTPMSCVGGDGYEDGDTGRYTGGGGGGHATDGGTGGQGLITTTAGPTPGGLHGFAYDNPDLQPLRGGCSGGGASSSPQGPGTGGGAIQITGRTRIVIDGGRIIANGTGGSRVSSHAVGGGAGGAILLECPEIEIHGEARVVANGGSGSAGTNNADPVPTSVDDAPTPGGGVDVPACQLHSCSNGGDGAAATTPPGDGDRATAGADYSGAGGGAVGYVRINTADGSFTIASSAVISPSATSATLVRR